MSDYYLGGKKMGFWAVAFSARATGESGWLLIGLTGMGAMAGYSGYWVVVGELLGVFISWQFMAKRFKKRSDAYGAITIPDYLNSHFKSKTHTLRIIAASVLVIFIVIYVASQIDVTGVAFKSMLGIDYKVGALIGFFIVLAYIFVGGFVAAVWSDFFQGLLMFFWFSSIANCCLVLYGSWRRNNSRFKRNRPNVNASNGQKYRWLDESFYNFRFFYARSWFFRFSAVICSFYVYKE